MRGHGASSLLYKSRKEKSFLLELQPGWSIQVNPSGVGFGSEPSWRCQEERGHFAALLARGETPTKLLPEPDPPGELWAGLGETSRLCFSQLGTQPSSPWNGNIYFGLSCCTAHGPCPAFWRARAGQGWGQSWLSSTGVTRIGDKHPGTTRERVLGLGSCLALCLKILEPDKMGLQGGFSHGFEFFQVS